MAIVPVLVTILGGCSLTPGVPTQPSASSRRPTSTAARPVVVRAKSPTTRGRRLPVPSSGFSHLGAEAAGTALTDKYGLYAVQLAPGTYTAGCRSSGGTCRPDLPGNESTIRVRQSESRATASAWASPWTASRVRRDRGALPQRGPRRIRRRTS
jgi:hypothetical protein